MVWLGREPPARRRRYRRTSCRFRRDSTSRPGKSAQDGLAMRNGRLRVLDFIHRALQSLLLKQLRAEVIHPRIQLPNRHHPDPLLPEQMGDELVPPVIRRRRGRSRRQGRADRRCRAHGASREAGRGGRRDRRLPRRRRQGAPPPHESLGPAPSLSDSNPYRHCDPRACPAGKQSRIGFAAPGLLRRCARRNDD